MGHYKDLVHKLPEEKDIMEKLLDITDSFLESIKVNYPQKFNSFINEVKELTVTGHFTEEAYDALEAEHYTLEDTTNYAKENYEIDFDKECFNQYDFNFIMNEMYKLFNPIYQDEMDKYTELTIAWLDYNKGKALWYYDKLYK